MFEKFDLLKHFGVYGVAIDNEKLLVIEKNSGPYQNRYDLPGGSQEVGESWLTHQSDKFLKKQALRFLQVLIIACIRLGFMKMTGESLGTTFSIFLM